MTQCSTLVADLDSLYPVNIGRKTPTEARRPTVDWAVVDCAGTGVTIQTSTWTIHPDDDDATLTLSQQATTGLETSVLASGGTDGNTYRLVNQVITSDGRTVELTVVVPVFVTKAIAA